MSRNECIMVKRQVQQRIRWIKQYWLAINQQKNKLHPTNRQKKLRRLSEIPSSLLSRHHELVLDNLWRRRPLGMKCQLEVADDPIDNFVVFDKGDHLHLSAALRAEQSIIEFWDPEESTAFCHTSLCEKKVQVRVKIYSGSKRLYHGHNTWYNFFACYGPEVFQNCPFSAETETTEKRAFVFEEYSQHLGNGEDHLAVRNIKQERLPHPLAPLLTSFGIAWGAESTNFTWKGQQPFRSTVRTANSCKPTLRIATVQVLVHDLLDNRTEISILSLKAVLVFWEKLIEVVEKYSVEDRAFRMTLTIYPCHWSRDDSENMPNPWLSRKMLISPVKNRDQVMSWMERGKQLFTFMKLTSQFLLTKRTTHSSKKNDIFLWRFPVRFLSEDLILSKTDSTFSFFITPLKILRYAFRYSGYS